jgi:hypothetical protein
MKEYMKKEQEEFTCSMAQNMITPYINDRLSMQETERFIRHVETCSECKEELWVYYTIMTGMKKLDDDENMSMDFTAELRRKLKKSEDKILRHKRTLIVKRILFVAVIICGIWLDVAVDTRKEPEKSNFELQQYFFKGRYSKTGEYVDKHYNSMMGEKIRYSYGNELVENK